MNAETFSDQEITERFTYHKPIGNQPQRYEAIRNKAKELAFLIRDCCPASRERSLALTNLQLTTMLANAAIACGENESTATVVWEETPVESVALAADIAEFLKISPADRIAMLAKHGKEES